MTPLEAFSPATRAWFVAAFAAPTPAQEGAWRAVSAGRSALVVAPTGSGKTLAAFLWALDRLAAEPAPEKARRCRVLYVSPLKALAVDVERNLRTPLAGIRGAAVRLGLPEPDVRVAVRSGDTSAEERRKFLTAPADILITTPESLFLLLTSRSRESLRGVRTVIVDEVHAVAATKRGAHLALSLERLDALLDAPAQRIGLSATVRPLDEVARFLGGQHPVDVVQPPTTKTIELSVQVPVADLTALGDDSGAPADGASAAASSARSSIWPSLERRVLDLVGQHRSTIVFANSRRLAERLCARLNELAEQDRAEAEASAPAGAGPTGLGPPGLGPPGLEPPEPRGPAESGGAAGAAHGAGDLAVGTAQGDAAGPMEIARPHHGSMSREQRTLVEDALKSGQLPCVVATSSLELGIDMGAVDLVVQVESPPSVASGLQRVGRAGHQVGAPSRGVLLPKHRGDLLPSAVVAERMRQGGIEALHYPRNPLDVLAQQIVAMLAMEPWSVDDLAALVRRAAPFAGLPQSALEATLDMLAGRYPSDAFAELRPRVVWDRIKGELSARPGAQRLAVTSGGTIPDRGLFTVFLASGDGSGRRVGELDEEMVYESRQGDVILLGSSSWRIEEITHDRVLVVPAPGQPGKLPFWHGDAPGRPVELGRALGAFVRTLAALAPEAARTRLAQAGLDEWAIDNTLAYLEEQRAATSALPDDRTIVVERFRDELGDWRLTVHSPFGAQVHAPWALAVAARVRERLGVDAQVLHSDDGLVLRMPEGDEAPNADLVLLDPDEVEQLVQAEVGGSPLFASRFRECAARSLLLPRRDPRRRTPLWQQRQRSAQLLSVASVHPDFPVVLETMRECLQDVFDVPGLVGLMRDLAGRAVRLVEVETATPSPFARALLFGYVGAFMYEGDTPLAERRAQALSLDSGLLAELLGTAELRELLDPDALAEIEAELQRLADDRRPRSAEETADLLRVVGDLSADEARARGVDDAWLAELADRRRVMQVRIAGEQRWASVEDAARLRDALGVALPVGLPQAFLEPVRDPLGDLVSRYARTHGPFHPAAVSTRFGLGIAVVEAALARLAASGRVVHGEFRPGGTGLEWCDAEVLRSLRRRSLAKLRKEVEPVPPEALARFLPQWQGLGVAGGRGADGLLRAVEQLQGAVVPASALESLVLPSRVAGYGPMLLDELTAAGEVLWAGHGSLPGNDGWVSLQLADSADLLLPEQLEHPGTPLHVAVLEALAGGQALFFRSLSDRVSSLDDVALQQAVWDLVWSGHLTNDTLSPLRALLGAGRTTHSAKRPPARQRSRYGRPVLPTRTGPPTTGGRWSLLPARDRDPTRHTHALAEALLDRHGVVTRGAVVAERAPGGFSAVYGVLKAFEEAGRVRRGYFVEGLGAAQFAAPGAVDRMRALAAVRPVEDDPLWTPPVPGGWDTGGQRKRRDDARAVVVAATDPANPYGAALPWPVRDDATGHKPARKAGALAVLVDGACVLYVERGGKTLLSFTEEPGRLTPAVDALALAVRDGALGKLTVEKADGEAALTSTLGLALENAGFRPTPRGLRLRAR